METVTLSEVSLTQKAGTDPEATSFFSAFHKSVGAMHDTEGGRFPST